MTKQKGLPMNQTLNHFGNAIRFFKKHPKMYFKAIIPILLSGIIVAIVVSILSVIFYFVSGMIISQFSTLAQYSIILQILSSVVFAASLFFFSYTVFTNIALNIGDAYYEKLWQEIEKESLGEELALKLKFNATAMEKIKEETYTLRMSIVASLKIAGIVFLISLVPIVGNILGIVFGFLASGLLTTEDHTRRALKGRNYHVKERIQLMKDNRKAAYNFGVVSQLMFLVPFIHLALMPITVAASTYFVHTNFPEITE